MLQRYAIVLDGIVTGITEWDAEAAPDWVPLEGEAVLCDETASVGFVAGPGGITPPDPSTLPVPPSISSYQFHAALDARGKWAAADKALAKHARIALRLQWSRAPDVPRDGELVAAVQDALEFSPAETDALFREAEGIG